MVRKAKTETQGQMGMDTLSAKVVHKTRMNSMGISSPDFKPSGALLKRAKTGVVQKHKAQREQ